MQYVQLFLTFRCNKGCAFCFNRGINNNGNITLDKFRLLSLKLRNYGIEEIDILGGEPLLHKDIIELLRLASNNFRSVYISTNGSFINRLEMINSLFPHVTTGISINGKIEEETKKYILSKRSVVKSVVSREEFIPEVSLSLIKEGIPYYLIYRDILSPEESSHSIPFYEFLSRFNEIQRVYKNLMPVFCEGFVTDKDYRCPVGTTKLSIMPDGSVYPCYLLFRFEQFKLGNIFKDTLEDILNSPRLEFFKRFSRNPCARKDCALHSRCHGGCPAISYIFYGRLDGPDPRCI